MTDVDRVRRPSESDDGTVEALERAQDSGVTDHAEPSIPGPDVLGGGDVGGSGSMSAKVATGASWSAISKLSSQAVQFAAGLVLARLLTPADYGTMASVYVLTGFAILFFELGLGSTVIALRLPTQKDLSTVFWVNALGGVVFTLLLAGAGPVVAALFDDQRLRVLTPLVGLTFLFGLGSVHNSLLQRQLRFKTIAVISVSTSAVGLAVTVVCAALGAGVYALTIGPICTSALSSILSWILVPWRPTSFISRSSLPTLWKFSGGQLGFNVVNYWGRNADNFLVARYVGDTALGYYNKAYSLMLLPIQQVSSVLGRVMFPALAAMKGDAERVARGYRRALRLINIATVPVLLGMAVTAPGLVPLLWGDQWVGAVHLLMVLCIAGVPQCLATSVGWLYQSQNRTGRMFRMGVVTSVLGLLLMVLGIWLDGAMGVAVAVLLRAWLFTGPVLHYAGALVGLRARTVVRDTAPVLLVSVGMGAVVWFTPPALAMDRTDTVATVIQVAVGVAVFALGSVLFLRTSVRELRDLVLRRSAPG